MLKKMFIICLVIVFSIFMVSPSFALTAKEEQDKKDAEAALILIGLILLVVWAASSGGHHHLDVAKDADEQKEKSIFMPEFKFEVTKFNLPSQTHDGAEDRGVPSLKAVWTF